MDIPYKQRITMAAKNYSKDNEYYTPKTVVSYFGKFDYDPAITKEKAEEFDIKYYDTVETDGLKADWSKYKRIWINPPFTLKKEFISKAVETYKIDKSKEIYILVPIEFITTNVFYKLTKEIGCKIFIPSGRIKFESGLGKKSSSPGFGSVILLLNEKWEVELIDIKKLLP